MPPINEAYLRKYVRFPAAVYLPFNLLHPLDGYEGLYNRKLDQKMLASIAKDFKLRALSAFHAFVDPVTFQCYVMDGHHRSEVLRARIAQGKERADTPLLTILHTAADAYDAKQTNREYIEAQMKPLNVHGVESMYNTMQRAWPATPWGEAYARIIKNEPLWGNTGFTATNLLKARARVDHMRAQVTEQTPAIAVLLQPAAHPTNAAALQTMLTTAPADVERTLRTVCAWETRVAQALAERRARKTARRVDAWAFALMVGDGVSADRLDDVFARTAAHFPSTTCDTTKSADLWEELLFAANWKYSAAQSLIEILGVSRMKVRR